MSALTRNEYDIATLALAWIVGFTPLLLEHAPARWRPRRAWTWVQCLGLALVAVPFVRMAINVWLTIGALFVFTVLEPLPRDAMWRSIGRELLIDLALPLVGLLVLRNAFPGWRSRRVPEQPTGEALRAHGMPHHSWGRDALRGLALFFAIAIAYVAAYGIASLVSPQAAGGDESRYWIHITPVLIVLLSGVSGLTEEFLFRGVLLRSLATRMPWIAAALAQALFFGLVHAGYGTWTHVVGPFAFGLGMAWVSRELGVVTAMLLHAEVNVVFFAIDVSGVVPGAWWVLGALAVVNVVAAVLTRMDAVAILWRSLRHQATSRSAA